MKNLLTIMVVLCLTALGISACASSQSNSSAISSLNGTAWELVSAATPSGVKMPDNAQRPVFIAFIDGTRAVGMAGVNRYNASVKTSAPNKNGVFNVKFGPAAATLMAGPFMQFEQFFFQSLDKTDSIRATNDKLELISGGKVLMTFKRNDSLK